VIEKDIPESFATAAAATFKVVSPSSVEMDTVDVQVEVIFGKEPSDYRIEGVSPASIGTLAHKLMELNPKNLKIAAETLIKNEGLTLDVESLLGAVKALQKEEIEKRVSKAKRVLREVLIPYPSVLLMITILC